MKEGPEIEEKEELLIDKLTGAKTQIMEEVVDTLETPD